MARVGMGQPYPPHPLPRLPPEGEGVSLGQLTARSILNLPVSLKASQQLKYGKRKANCQDNQAACAVGEKFVLETADAFVVHGEPPVRPLR